MQAIRPQSEWRLAGWSGSAGGGLARQLDAPATRRAFTLTELLVVIAIIGVLAVSGIPAIRGLTKANTVAAGSRQVLDDLAFARQSALSGRRTVYMVFVPPTMREHFQLTRREKPPARADRLSRQMTNLLSFQYTGYALFSRRTVGDQPGRQTPRFLTEWRQLTEGMYFATNKFADLGRTWGAAATNVFATNVVDRPLPFGFFPFPTADSPEMRLPYIAFDPSGRMFYEEGQVPPYRDAVISLSRGSIIHPRDKRGNWLILAPDVVETAGAKSQMNRVHVLVNWLTGRAQALEVKLP